MNAKSCPSGNRRASWLRGARSMPSLTGSPGDKQFRQRGLTLIELMVSITIGLLLVIGLVTLLASISSSHRELDKASRQVENGRYALEILGNEVRHSGYYGPLSNAPALPIAVTSADPLPDPCSTSLVDTGSTPVEVGVRSAMALPIQGYVGAATASDLGNGFGSCLNSANYKAGTAVLVVRRAATKVGFNSGSYNIQVSACAGDSQPYLLLDDTASTNFTLHANTAPGCIPITSANVATIAPYLTHIFFVSTCSTTTSGGACRDTIPTLKRVDITPAGATTTSMVEGIDNIQFDYGIDNSPIGGDGAPDVYTSEAGHSLPTPSDLSEWVNVVAVRVHVLARNTELTAGYSDQKTFRFQVGPVPVTITSADADANYKRHVYSELVRINNVAGRRE